MSPSPYALFVGVDIAAATFTAVWARPDAAPHPAQTFDQTPAGFHAFQERLAATGAAPAATLVVLEATGSYWIALAVALHDADYHVSVINPARILNYARSLPRRAKTDALDAHVLAQFAAERRPAVWTPPPQVYHELRQRLVTRDALLQMRQQARNQRHALLQWPVVVPTVRQQFDEIIADLDERIDQLETGIVTLLRDSAWAESAALLSSIPGLGPLTTAWLLVTTINFTACPSVAAAIAYAGLAPMAHDSGSSVHERPRIGHAGNTRLRTALYLATLSAAQHNPMIKAFYTRLRAAGKPMKVARCAAARKLLELAWAVVAKRQRFDPAYAER